MTWAVIDGLRIRYEIAGQGPPVALVHGSWDEGASWAAVAGALSQKHTVLIYDRRGHGDSDRPDVPGRLRADVDDLEALIEQVGLGPVHLAGLSATTDLLDEVQRHIRSSAELVARSCPEEAARHFVDHVAHHPGTWTRTLTDRDRRLVARNADGWLDRLRDPDRPPLPIVEIAAAHYPVLLTRGGQSPLWAEPIVSELVMRLPRAEVAVLTEIGHSPHVTHPQRYANVLGGFAQGAGAGAIPC